MRIDRRTTIKWLAAAMTAVHTAACSSDEKFLGDEIPRGDNRLLGAAGSPDTVGYGTDPDLLNPVVPWSRTLTGPQLRTTAALCDAILPEDEHSPAASAVGVPDFIDEWVSAPYSEQQHDRETILAGLEWLERQSRERFGAGFADAAEAERAELLDALSGQEVAAPLADHHRFFDRFRYLAVGAFYTTQAGIDDIGYTGNVAIRGDYPGPSEQAMAHLAEVLGKLGLSLRE